MRLTTKTWLPVPRDLVFAFFSSSENLEFLTPDWLQFEILSERPIAMRAGTLIDYRIRLHGVPLKWRTEIAVWDPPHVFVDSQLRGPYRTWIHTHRFTEHAAGTLVEDEVDFRVLGGRVIAWLVVRDLKRIFAHRHEALLRAFDLPVSTPAEILISATQRGRQA
ncbi:MAG: SRPBCC family protein [Acidimicrobiia bacterium]|nr:SRPBCC family protein [Acidimicrobiia bacterium]